MLYPIGEELSNELKFVRQHDVHWLVGKILTIIESIGLKETQEEAVKSLIKKELWGHWEQLINTPEEVESLWKAKLPPDSFPNPN